MANSLGGGQLVLYILCVWYLIFMILRFAISLHYSLTLNIVLKVLFYVKFDATKSNGVESVRRKEEECNIWTRIIKKLPTAFEYQPLFL